MTEIPTPISRFWVATLILVMGVAHADPKMHVPKPEHNFGEVMAGEDVKHEFEFKNTGNELLEIQDIKTSCGCTAALSSQNTIKPGATGLISAKFDTLGRSSYQTKTITVRTNDPTNATVSMTLTGKVTPYVSIDPNFVNFGSSIRKGEGATQTTRIFTTLKTPFKILSVTCNVPEVTVKTEPYKTERDMGFKMYLTLDKNAKPDSYSGKVTLHLDHKKMEFVELHFYAKVIGEIVPTPSYFVYGRIGTGDVVTKEVRLTGAGNKSFKITGKEVPSEHMSLSIEDDGNAKILKLTVRKAPVGRLRGKVMITTDIDGDIPVEIPVYGRVTE